MDIVFVFKDDTLEIFENVCSLSIINEQYFISSSNYEVCINLSDVCSIEVY